LKECDLFPVFTVVSDLAVAFLRGLNMKDLIESLSVGVRDRLVSPLSGAFMVSWLVVNYKFILVFFGGMRTRDKITYVASDIFPDGLTILLSGAVYPLLGAFVYVYLYPLISIKVLDYTLTQNRKHQAVRQKIDMETPLTVEESVVLKKEINQRIQEIEAALEAKAQQVRDLKSKEAEHESEVGVLEVELNNFRAKEKENSISLKKLAQFESTLKKRDSSLEELKHQITGLQEIILVKEGLVSEANNIINMLQAEQNKNKSVMKAGHIFRQAEIEARDESEKSRARSKLIRSSLSGVVDPKV
jgi:hypothetical protein